MASGAGGPLSPDSPKRSATKPAVDRQGADRATSTENKPDPSKIKEIGGPKGPEPTRYGDWEKGGRCSDF
jgi:hypothetical protein